MSSNCHRFIVTAIYMAISRFGYVGLVRTMDGRGNLAAAIDLRKLKSVADPAQVVHSILEDAGLPSPTLSESDVWRGTIPLMRHTNRLSTHRVLLLGDAAGYAEPFTGEGIGWALNSAVAVTPVVTSNLYGGMQIQSTNGRLPKGGNAARTSRLSGFGVLIRRPTVVRLALGPVQHDSFVGTAAGTTNVLDEFGLGLHST